MELLRWLVAIAVMASTLSFAEPPDDRPPANRPPDKTPPPTTPVNVNVEAVAEAVARQLQEQWQKQQQEQEQSQGQDQRASSELTVTGSRYPKQVPNGYLNYSPNYIDCQRVIGLQWGNSSGIGSFGAPIRRDRSCDLWKAVNEAQENGHILLSYAFMCEIRNVKKVWGLARCEEITGLVDKWWVGTTGSGGSPDDPKTPTTPEPLKG